MAKSAKQQETERRMGIASCEKQYQQYRNNILNDPDYIDVEKRHLVKENVIKMLKCIGYYRLLANRKHTETSLHILNICTEREGKLSDEYDEIRGDTT